jgi:SAM-dependent methyltransferase
VLGVDRSEGYVEYATRRVSDIRACFEVGDAQALAADGDTFDVAVSGLVLNFVPNPGEMLREMSRVVVPGGCVGVYVWDYGEGMEMLRRFWDAAVALDPAAEALDEGRRFPICRREALGEALERAGLDEVETSAIIVPAQFESFEAFWSPFLGGQGPAPGYAVGLDDDARARLKERIREEMPPQTDVGLRLDLRAWAARGVVGHTA